MRWQFEQTAPIYWVTKFSWFWNGFIKIQKAKIYLHITVPSLWCCFYGFLRHDSSCFIPQMGNYTKKKIVATLDLFQLLIYIKIRVFVIQWYSLLSILSANYLSHVFFIEWRLFIGDKILIFFRKKIWAYHTCMHAVVEIYFCIENQLLCFPRKCVR